jgi:hypothetical protein
LSEKPGTGAGGWIAPFAPGRSFRFAGFPHSPNETKAPLLQRLDKALLIAGIGDRGAGRVEAGRERRVRDNPASPYRRDQVVLADHAFPVAYQVKKNVKCLRRHRNRVGPPMQFPFFGVECKVLKQIAQPGASVP